MSVITLSVEYAVDLDRIVPNHIEHQVVVNGNDPVADEFQQRILVDGIGERMRFQQPDLFKKLLED